MTQAPVTPQPSMTSSVPASTAAYQPAPAQTAPASYPTATAPQAEQVYSQAPVAQANPWQEAFNRLSESLSATRSSQSQAPYSAPTPQAAPSPEAYWQQAASYQAAPSVSGTPISPLPQTQAYSQATYQQAPTWNSAATASASDGYLESVSNESLEVLEHFGLEAPALLNRYACVVEDALLAQATQTAEVMQKVEQLAESLEAAKLVINSAAEDNAAYHTMLTDPDLLAEYVNEFFGPEGPYPTETAEDRLAAEVYANEARNSSAPVFQRPQMDIPSPGVQASESDDFWGMFSAISERNPAAAWQMLSQASPEALRSKLLISEA